MQISHPLMPQRPQLSSRYIHHSSPNTHKIHSSQIRQIATTNILKLCKFDVQMSCNPGLYPSCNCRGTFYIFPFHICVIFQCILYLDSPAHYNITIINSIFSINQLTNLHSRCLDVDQLPLAMIR